MKKFNKTFRGYNPKEVNAFLDEVIVKLEKIISDSKKKDEIAIAKDKTIIELQNELNRYKQIERTLNSTITNAQANNDRIRYIAKEESDAIINESRKNANRIISDALNRAEKVQYRAEMLKKNINMYKKRMKTMLEQQLDLINDMDSDEYKVNDGEDIL